MNDARAAIYEPTLDGGNRRFCAILRCHSRYHCPRLNQRINLAFIALGGTDRLAIIVVRAPIPLAVPTACVQRLAKTFAIRLIPRNPFRITSARTYWQHSFEHIVDKKPEPDALSPTLPANAAESVVPVAATDERQAMCSRRQPSIECTTTMLVNAGANACWLRSKIRFLFTRRQLRRADE